MAATILIADDDAVQRRLVENMVQRSGYQAMAMDSGDAAIAHITSDNEPRIDAIVLDLVMPEMSGYDVLRALKTNDATRRIPVVVHTGKFLDDTERAHLVESGAAVVHKNTEGNGDDLVRALAAVVSAAEKSVSVS